jgi:negative regulator of flagellin synthesis FlgM
MRVIDSISFPEHQDLSVKVGSANAPKAQGQSAAMLTKDATAFSTDQQKVSDLKAQLANLPDIRQEKVKQLRNAVQTGTYEVSAGKIAEAMLTDLGGLDRSSK